MSRDLKYQKENIELRRGKVLELLTKGYTQIEIAKTLNVSNALVSLDMQDIREKSKKELETHLSDRLPYEHARATAGINAVLKRVSEMLDEAKDQRVKMECMKLQMELYKSIMSLATDGGIVERAMKMVKIISPLPGEDIPAKSEEDKDGSAAERVEDVDIITEEEEEEEDPPTEPEEDLKEEE
jgi:transcriptional regulator